MSVMSVVRHLVKAAIVGQCHGCNAMRNSDEHLGTLPHTCPYASEINNDDTTLCNCCDDCAHECAMDI